MSSWPLTIAFHWSFGLNSDAPGKTWTSRPTLAALASRAMIWTISSRASPLPPGNWCDALSTVCAWAAAENAQRAAAKAAANFPIRLLLYRAFLCLQGTQFYEPCQSPGRRADGDDCDRAGAP